MLSKFLRSVLAAMMILLPLQGQLYAAVTVLQSASVGAEGTLTNVSTLTVTIRNSADDTVNATGLGFNAGAGATVVTSPQYLDVSYNDNTIGFQATTIKTDNRSATANPKYNGIAQGSGLVGVTDSSLTTPLSWVVFDATVTNTKGVNGGKGYAFNVPLKTDREFFVQDQNQGTVTTASKPGGDPALGSSLCNDKNKDGVCNGGEFTDRNGNGVFNPYREGDGPPKAANLLEGIDWDGNGFDGTAPFDAGFASFTFAIDNLNSLLANAPEDKNPTVDDDNNPATPIEIDGPNRTVTDGNVKTYLATDYKGAPAQQYKTNKLTMELVTIS